MFCKSNFIQKSFICGEAKHYSSLFLPIHKLNKRDYCKNSFKNSRETNFFILKFWFFNVVLRAILILTEMFAHFIFFFITVYIQYVCKQKSKTNSLHFVINNEAYIQI